MVSMLLENGEVQFFARGKLLEIPLVGTAEAVGHTFGTDGGKGKGYRAVQFHRAI